MVGRGGGRLRVSLGRMIQAWGSMISNTQLELVSAHVGWKKARGQLSLLIAVVSVRATFQECTGHSPECTRTSLAWLFFGSHGLCHYDYDMAWSLAVAILVAVNRVKQKLRCMCHHRFSSDCSMSPCLFYAIYDMTSFLAVAHSHAIVRRKGDVVRCCGNVAARCPVRVSLRSHSLSHAGYGWYCRLQTMSMVSSSQLRITKCLTLCLNSQSFCCCDNDVAWSFSGPFFLVSITHESRKFLGVRKGVPSDPAGHSVRTDIVWYFILWKSCWNPSPEACMIKPLLLLRGQGKMLASLSQRTS